MLISEIQKNGRSSKELQQRMVGKFEFCPFLTIFEKFGKI
jgi:hypothetical protein